MKKTKIAVRIISFITAVLIALTMVVMLAGCTSPDGSAKDTMKTREAAARIQENQPTPTDIEYSLERYNLIRRAYWVNGQREKANALVCPVEKPMGYVILLTEGGSVVGSFTVDGKVSSLNSFLTPDSEYYEMNGATSMDDDGDRSYKNRWLADVDGSYGENDNGVFFFTPDGKYVEWSGIYLYSDIPFQVDAPVINYTEVE